MKLKIIFLLVGVGAIFFFLLQSEDGHESIFQNMDNESKIHKNWRKSQPKREIPDAEEIDYPPFSYLRLKSRLMEKVSKSHFILPEYRQGIGKDEVLLLVRKHISFRLERIPVCSFEDDLFFYFWNNSTPRAGEAVYKETGEVVGWGWRDCEVND